MARKHKHEEHVNLERWVISYADMVTLLFALFVVLYAIGVVELEKLEQLKQSIQFAFHIEGEGKTKKEGLYDFGTGDGQLPDAVPLVNSQDGKMEEFLLETLPEEFERVTGISIDIVQTDDTITIRTSLAAFFAYGEPLPIRARVQVWFNKVVKHSINFASDIRIRIEAPDVVIGRDANNRAVRSSRLCLERLEYLRHVMTLMPKIWGDSIDLEFKTRPWRSAALRQDWEEDAELIIAFANKSAQAVEPSHSGERPTKKR